MASGNKIIGKVARALKDHEYVTASAILIELPAESASAAQPGEAIRELAESLFPNYSPENLAAMIGVIESHLAPLLEKAQRCTHGLINSQEELEAELARWAEGEKK